jgi:hypothetical protein
VQAGALKTGQPIDIPKGEHVVLEYIGVSGMLPYDVGALRGIMTFPGCLLLPRRPWKADDWKPGMLPSVHIVSHRS